VPVTYNIQDEKGHKIMGQVYGKEISGVSTKTKTVSIIARKNIRRKRYVNYRDVEGRSKWLSQTKFNQEMRKGNFVIQGE